MLGHPRPLICEEYWQRKPKPKYIGDWFAANRQVLRRLCSRINAAASTGVGTVLIMEDFLKEGLQNYSKVVEMLDYLGYKVDEVNGNLLISWNSANRKGLWYPYNERLFDSRICAENAIEITRKTLKEVSTRLGVRSQP